MADTILTKIILNSNRTSASRKMEWVYLSLFVLLNTAETLDTVYEKNITYDSKVEKSMHIEWELKRNTVVSSVDFLFASFSSNWILEKPAA